MDKWLQSCLCEMKGNNNNKKNTIDECVSELTIKLPESRQTIYFLISTKL
jgi:hypothetical protein